MATRQSIGRSDLTPAERAVAGEPGDLISEAPVPERVRSRAVMVSLRLDRRTFDALSSIAENRGRTFSDTAREALRAFVEGPSDRSNRPPETTAEKVSVKASEAGATYSPSGQGVKAQTWTDDELERALARYEDACRAANMRSSAWRSYVDYARRFVAWRKGAYRPRGASRSGRPVPASAVTTAELRAQASRYARDVELAGRERPTFETYFRHAMFFVRWLDGEFEPGSRLSGLR
jgi:hypothetical protein